MLGFVRESPSLVIFCQTSTSDNAANQIAKAGGFPTLCRNTYLSEAIAKRRAKQRRNTNHARLFTAHTVFGVAAVTVHAGATPVKAFAKQSHDARASGSLAATKERQRCKYSHHDGAVAVRIEPRPAIGLDHSESHLAQRLLMQVLGLAKRTSGVSQRYWPKL